MIRHDDRDGVRVLVMEHGKVNALDLELLQELETALVAAQDAGRNALVLTGAGSSFSAGVDLWRILDGGPQYVRAFLPALTRTLHRLFTFPGPAVAAVNGHAIAGGAILACACERRFMARGRGRIGIPELRVGVPFPAVVLEIVRAAVPDGVAAELALTGVTWSAEDAARRGLVDELVEPEALLERAWQEAASLATIPPAAYRLAKQQLRQPGMARWETLAPHLDPQVEAAWCAPETASIIRAYLDRTLGKGR